MIRALTVGMDTKTIVITGASGGIGAATAHRLGRDGHNLVLAARREAALATVAEGIAGDVLTVPTDVTRRADVERLRDRALERFGAVDVWINNAGRGLSVPVLELTDADIDDMITTNVKSALYGMQVIVPHFKERGRGHLINVSSFLARAPLAPVRSAYSAAKAALNSLTSNLRMELAQPYPQIHVSTVMPGMVQTDFATNAMGDGGVPVPPPAAASAAMGIQTADDVAEVIAALIERPRAEVYTNPTSPETARRWFDSLRAFEPL